LVGGDGHELVSSIADSRGGEAEVCGTLDESGAVDFSSEQLAFQQRKLHAVRSGCGIKHGRSPGAGVAYETRGKITPRGGQTNLLLDGIGRYFGIELAAISFFPVLRQCIRRRGQGCTGIESSSDHGTTSAHVSSIE
jgi:hypothetical protein